MKDTKVLEVASLMSYVGLDSADRWQEGGNRNTNNWHIWWMVGHTSVLASTKIKDINKAIKGSINNHKITVVMTRASLFTFKN